MHIHRRICFKSNEFYMVAPNDYPLQVTKSRPTCARTKIATIHFNDSHQPEKCIRYTNKSHHRKNKTAMKNGHILTDWPVQKYLVLKLIGNARYNRLDPFLASSPAT